MYSGSEECLNLIKKGRTPPFKNGNIEIGRLTSLKQIKMGVAEMKWRRMVLSSATINYLKTWKSLINFAYTFTRARGVPPLIGI